MSAAPASVALLTDQYELTMIDAALRSGVADLPATFEVFCRRLPPGRRYGVVAGTGRLLAALEDFRFGPAELDFLRAGGHRLRSRAGAPGGFLLLRGHLRVSRG